jgi:AcrR family transcriptional regulator
VRQETTGREQLLDGIADYCLGQGVADLTLRSVGRAVGSNNRMLLYYFGSKEAMISAALQHAGARFPDIHQAFELLHRTDRPLADCLDDTWRAISAEANLPFTRLFFEVFGLAAHQPGRFDAFLGSVGHDWSAEVASAFRRDGTAPATARRIGIEVVALWRGLQMDLLSGGDRARIHKAHRDAVNRVVHSSSTAT